MSRIFLGYHEDLWLGVPAGRVQAIYVARIEIGKVVHFEIHRSLGTLFRKPGQLVIQSGIYLAKWRFPQGVVPEPRLKVVVRRGDVREIWWSGQKLDELCSPQIEAEVNKQRYSYAGPFGAFVLSGEPTWVRSPRFTKLDQK